METHAHGEQPVTVLCAQEASISDQIHNNLYLLFMVGRRIGLEVIWESEHRHAETMRTCTPDQAPDRVTVLDGSIENSDLICLTTFTLTIHIQV